jgi:putative ABC transport system permease protein
MRDWRQFVRAECAHPLSDQAVEELAQHVEETWRAARAAGRSEADALDLARGQLQNVSLPLPETMIARPPRGMRSAFNAVWRDAVYASRLLRRRPGFTAVAVLTLALGIGANTAIFSVVRSLFLQPLPFADPGRLVMLWEADAQNPARTNIVSAPNYLDFARGVASFEKTGIWEYLSFNLSGDTEAERVQGMRVSASTFEMLGVAPALGRTFTVDEDAPGHDVAVISYRLWQRRFGGRSNIVGQSTRINGKAYEIIGVMPQDFLFPWTTIGVWTPIAFNEEDRGRNSHSFFAAARLYPGVSIEAANAVLDTLARGLAKQYPDSNGRNTATVTPMRDLGVGQLRPTLLALAGAVAFVLAIACVNVANLLLAQAAARRREFAIRAAIGASRRRLAAQLFTEALIIAVAGGAAGIGIAAAATSLLEGVLPPSIVSAPFRNAGAIHVDRVVLAFTVGISLLTGLLFGLAPMAALRRGGGADLKASGDRSATGRMTSLRTALVGTEVALALVVLVGAGLMVKSLVKLVRNDPGLDSSNVLLATMSLPQPDFYGPPIRKTFCDEVTDRVGGLPGIVAVGAVSHLPLSGANAGRSLSIEGKTMPPGQNASAGYRLTCPGYFKAMRIRLLRGRDFDSRDATEAPAVVIINEETAKRYWPGEDPIGKRIKIGRAESQNPWMTVVGIVGNVRHFGLDDDVARREIFRPYSQAAWPVMTVVTRTASDPAGFAASIRAALQAIDPDLPVNRTTTMETIERASTGSRQFPMLLLGAFGVVALVLAVVGVYGVVSYLVSQRTREIGIRVALGARRAQVIALIVTGVMRPVLAGVVTGVIGAVFASRLLGALLYNVQPGDPAVLSTIAGVLAIAAIAAALVPAMRATRVDPIAVLKAD